MLTHRMVRDHKADPSLPPGWVDAWTSLHRAEDARRFNPMTGYMGTRIDRWARGHDGTLRAWFFFGSLGSRWAVIARFLHTAWLLAPLANTLGLYVVTGCLCAAPHGMLWGRRWWARSRCRASAAPCVASRHRWVERERDGNGLH